MTLDAWPDLRLVLPPLAAFALGVRAGLRDAGRCAPIYGWALVFDAAHREDLLRDGWRDVGKVFVLAVVMDLLFELIVLGGIRLGPPMLVGIALVAPAYLLSRGPVNRLVRRNHARPRARATG